MLECPQGTISPIYTKAAAEVVHAHGSPWRAAPLHTPSHRRLSSNSSDFSHSSTSSLLARLSSPSLIRLSLAACTRSLTHVIPLSSCDARSASHLRVSPSQAHCSVSPSPRQGPKGCACSPYERARYPQHSNQCAPQRIVSHHMPRMPYQRRGVCVIMVPRAIHMGPVAGIPYIARKLSKHR